MRLPALLVLALAALLAPGCTRCSAPPGPVVDAGLALVSEVAPPPRGMPAPSDVGAAPASSAPARRSGRPPPNGCRVQATRAAELPASDGVAGYLDGRPLVVALEREGRLLALWELADDGTLARRAERALDAPALRASLRCDRTCDLALVDERARLALLSVDASAIGPLRVVASPVDRRFAPALASSPAGLLVAYTATRDEVMHTLLVTASRALSAPRDLTPPGHGAAAATFVLGVEPPVLVAIDARAGVSPLLEIPFDAQGTPAPAIVRTPVSQPSAPPLLAATLRPGGEVEVYYSAVGRLAMTAVGRVLLRAARAPTALLPSSGYGALRFSAARGSRRTLIALETPSSAVKGAPRTLVLKLLDGGRTDDVLALGTAREEAVRPSLASGPSPGTFLLTYLSRGRLHVAELACDD